MSAINTRGAIQPIYLSQECIDAYLFGHTLIECAAIDSVSEKLVRKRIIELGILRTTTEEKALRKARGLRRNYVYQKFDLSPESIAFYIAGGSMVDIAKKEGVQQKTVSLELSRLGIKRSNLNRHTKLPQSCIDGYIAGKTIKETAKLANMDIEPTRRRLLELGILRPSHLSKGAK